MLANLSSLIIDYRKEPFDFHKYKIHGKNINFAYK